MNLSLPFIKRPIMTTLLMLSVLLAGGIAYNLLTVSDLPNVDRPTLVVNAVLPGANPETMASTVASPLEKELSSIAGIVAMNSVNRLGLTSITIEFTLERNIDSAFQDVQAAISRVSRRLPASMTSPPVCYKVNPADAPFLQIALCSSAVSLNDLDEHAQTLFAQKISMVSGVAQVQVWGSQKYCVRVKLDPYSMAAKGVGIDEVANVINQYNARTPLGSFSGPNKTVMIEEKNQLKAAEQFSPLIVVYRNGLPIRIRDIGTVVESVENDRVASWYVKKDSIQRSIGLGIYRQPGTNTVEVAEAVKAILPQLQEQLPADISMTFIRDSSPAIKKSASDVQFTLVLTLCLVVMVIFLFLRNVSATIIPSLALPVSVVGTFIAMYLLNFSLDNISLMALTLAVGFVVDDAIVMLENIVRHVEMGKSRLQAAIDGAKEIGFTIVSMTLSLAAVFIPVLFMGGIVGRLFREFSITIGVAVLISGVVSLTLTPMLCGRFLKDSRENTKGFLFRITESIWKVMVAFYDKTLSVVLRHKLATMIFSAAILGATVCLYVVIPKGFVPSEDRDQISIRTKASDDTSFDAMVKYQMTLAEIVRKDPDVERLFCNVGSGSLANEGNMFVLLKPRAERRCSADGIIERLRPKLASVPGVQSFLSNPPVLSVGGFGGRSNYQITLQGPEADELYKYAGVLEKKMSEMSLFQDVSSDMQLSMPQLNMTIDHDKAFILGLTPQQIKGSLYDAYGRPQISTIYTSSNQYQVILEIAPPYQSDPSVLSLLYVRSTKGRLVPITSVASMKETLGPLSISHSGQLTAVTFSFNLKSGVSLSQAVDELEKIISTTAPKGISYTFQGITQAFQKSLSGMMILLILAIAVIYVVLGMLYESFYHPLTILSALPFAGFGALVTLLIFREELSLYSFIGIVMLVGLVKKNGIMMIDFAIEARNKDGKSPVDAIREACIIRFRPITMTTVAALIASLPIAMGIGAGAESRRPLGLAVVGGLLFSQLLTLYVTPVFYICMEKLRAFIHSCLKRSKHDASIDLVLESPSQI